MEAIRSLPLSQEARLALLDELSKSATNGITKVHLAAEQAELHLLCCEHAYKEEQWLQAIQHHDALLELVIQLVRVLPDKAAAFWDRYGKLLAFLVAEIHPKVTNTSVSPPPQALRARICWLIAERLKLGRAFPFNPPSWLVVLEQQIVQDGALFWIELIDSEADEPPGLARQRAFELLVRLDQVLDPAPSWVLDAAKTHLSHAAQNLLCQPMPDTDELAKLCNDIALLSTASHDKQLLSVSLQRARHGLELLSPELENFRHRSASETFSNENIKERDLAPGVAKIALLGADETSSRLELNLAPLLANNQILAGELKLLDEALDDFIWHLPRGVMAMHAAPALVAVLEPAWRNGMTLEPEAFEALAYLGAAWQRRLSERLEPLPVLEVKHSMMIELDAKELAVVKSILAYPETLEPALAHLRREHHNQEFWSECSDHPWMRCPPILEALRCLHRDLGFYAQASQPAEDLQRWGAVIAQVLLESESWTDDAGCLGLWLSVAQELVSRYQQPLPTFGMPPDPNVLLAEFTGREVLYIGDKADAVREAHSAGRCFRGGPFGLRVLQLPSSRWPSRPAGGFWESMDQLLDAVDSVYRQRPFHVVLVDCSAYRLPLLRSVHQRYGVDALSSSLPMWAWLASG